MLRRTRRARCYLTAMAVAALPTIGVALPASADSTTATLNVGGGTLTETALSTGPSASVTLDGTDQTATYSMGITVRDARGTRAGWNLQITSTQFSTGGQNAAALPADASTATGVTVACIAGASCCDPTNSIAYPLTIPAGPTVPNPVKLFNAAAGTGLGRFTVTPKVQIAVPATTLAGSHTSTVTLSIVSGP